MDSTAPAVGAGAANLRLNFDYDSQARRIQKTVNVWNPSTLNYDLSTQTKFRSFAGDIRREFDLPKNSILPSIGQRQMNHSPRLQHTIPFAVAFVIAVLSLASSAFADFTRHSVHSFSTSESHFNPLSSMTMEERVGERRLQSNEPLSPVLSPFLRHGERKETPGSVPVRAFNGNLLTLTEGTRTITRQYDGLNRLTNYNYVDTADAQANYNVGFVLDANGNVTKIHYPDGKDVLYEYDSHNRLTHVTDWNARVMEYFYDLAGKVTSIQHANGTKRTIAYNADGTTDLAMELKPDGIALALFKLGYDSAGRIAHEVIAGANQRPMTGIEHFPSVSIRHRILLRKRVFDF